MERSQHPQRMKASSLSGCGFDNTAPLGPSLLEELFLLALSLPRNLFQLPDCCAAGGLGAIVSRFLSSNLRSVRLQRMRNSLNKEQTPVDEPPSTRASWAEKFPSEEPKSPGEASPSLFLGGECFSPVSLSISFRSWWAPLVHRMSRNCVDAMFFV